MINRSRGVELTFDSRAVAEMADVERADAGIAGGRRSWQFAIRRLFSNCWMFKSNISFISVISSPDGPSFMNESSTLSISAYAPLFGVLHGDHRPLTLLTGV